MATIKQLSPKAARLTKGNLKLAGFKRRLVASVFDSLILGLIQWGFFFTLGGTVTSFKVSTGGPMTLQFSGSLLISLLYTIGFWVKRGGQTPGKQIMHIKIITEDPKELDWFTAFIRYIGYWVSGIPLGLGYLWMLFDPNKQTWHDKIAKTYVVEADTKEPGKAVYIVGCLIPILLTLIFAGIFTIGLIAGFSKARSKLATVTSYQKSVKEMSPEAKTHFDRSQELFSQMRTASNDPTAVKKLNDENIGELKKALDIEPDNARLHSELCAAFTWISTSGTPNDAIAACGKAVDLEPENSVYLANLGDMLNRMGKYDDAILELQKATRISGDSYAYPYYQLGIAYTNLKIFDQARTSLQKSIDIYTKINTKGDYDDEILLAQKLMAKLPN